MAFIDQIPLLALFSACVLLLLLAIEIGFQYAKARHVKVRKEQMAQVRAIMGASLGLSAFMLAFSFSMAQQHFEERTRAYMLEVSAVDSAFRGADLLEDDDRDAAQDLLRQFLKLRIRTSEAARESDMEHVAEMIRESERIHDVLWAYAEASMEKSVDGVNRSLFAQSVLAMVAAHDARLQAAVFNRISLTIWTILVVMMLLAMVVMGYQAGLTGTRSSLATWTLAITFSAIMTVITDLDRPNMRLFQVNQQLMAELEGRMEHGGAAALGVTRP